MAPTLVQTRKTGIFSNSSFTPAALTTQPAAGNLLILVVALSKGSATVPTVTAPAGWSHMITQGGAANTTLSGALAVLGRIATGVAGAGTGSGASQTGGDDPPTVSITGTGSSNIAYCLEEWPGSGSGNIDTSSFPDVAAAVVTGTSTSGITGSGMTVTGSNEWAYVAYGGRAALSGSTITWGGSLAAECPVTGSGGPQLATATQTISATTITPSPTFTNSQGGPVNAIGSFAFKTLSGATVKSLSASLSFTSTQPRNVTHRITGGLSFTGSIPRQVRKGIAAVLSFTGTLSRNTVRVLASALSFTGTLPRQTRHGITAGLTPSATLNRAMSRALTAGLSFTGALVTSRFKQVLLDAALSFTGAATRAVTSNQRATLTPAGSLTRSTSKRFAATASFNGALSTFKTRVLNLAAALGFTGALNRQTGKNLPAGLTPTGALSRRATKTITAAVTFTGSLPKRVGKSLAAALALTANFVASQLRPRRDVTLALMLEPDPYTAILETDRFTVDLEPDRYLITLEDDVPRTIRASLGDQSYVSLRVTEANGEDITGDTFQISLGTYTAPGAWHSPDVSESVSAGVQRVKLLVGAAGTINPPAGVYYPWVRVADSPETESMYPRDRVTIL